MLLLFTWPRSQYSPGHSLVNIAMKIIITSLLLLQHSAAGFVIQDDNVSNVGDDHPEVILDISEQNGKVQFREVSSEEFESVILPILKQEAQKVKIKGYYWLLGTFTHYWWSGWWWWRRTQGCYWRDTDTSSRWRWRRWWGTRSCQCFVRLISLCRNIICLDQVTILTDVQQQ